MKNIIIIATVFLLVGAGCAKGTASPAGIELEGSGAAGTQLEGTPAVNDTPDAGIRIGEPNPSAPADERTVEGEIVAIDLDGIAADRPAALTLRTVDGEALVHVPSFGLNLCAASKDIADVYDLKVGASISVRGSVDESGAVVPCDAGHFLRRAN